MDELKLLVEMVANLPTLAVWVLVGFLCYKIAIVGSVYGVIKLAIVSIHDWLTRPKAMTLQNKTIDEAVFRDLTEQIRRLSTGDYIHPRAVRELKEWLDKRSM